MTVALDTTALLAVATTGPGRAVVLGALDNDALWSASALALPEALAAIDRLTEEAVLRADLEDAIRRLWDHVHLVPADAQLLTRAATIAREQPIRLGAAIHLAAAERMPGPTTFVTFDPHQITVALGLGLGVAST